MNYFELIAARQSGRSYDSTRPVEREKLVKILEAGAIAPSACNSQPWRFVAIDDKEMAAKVPHLLQRENDPINRFTNDCLAFIIICEAHAVLMTSMRDTTPSQKYAQLDLGIATAHMTLAATELGLDSCILGCFNEEALKELFGIPEELKIRLVMSVGYGKDSTLRPKKRNKFEDVVHFNNWD